MNTLYIAWALSAQWGGDRFNPGPDTGAAVEVDTVNKQRTFAGRALRVVAVSGIVFGTMAPVAAMAAPYPDTSPNTVARDPGDPGVQGATATRSATLPFTGGDAAGLAAIGVGAVAAGAVIVRQSRRRAHA